MKNIRIVIGAIAAILLAIFLPLSCSKKTAPENKWGQVEAKKVELENAKKIREKQKEIAELREGSSTPQNHESNQNSGLVLQTPTRQPRSSVIQVSSTVSARKIKPAVQIEDDIKDLHHKIGQYETYLALAREGLRDENVPSYKIIFRTRISKYEDELTDMDQEMAQLKAELKSSNSSQ